MVFQLKVVVLEVLRTVEPAMSSEGVKSVAVALPCRVVSLNSPYAPRALSASLESVKVKVASVASVKKELKEDLRRGPLDLNNTTQITYISVYGKRIQ